MEVTSDSIKLNSNAHNQPSTINPSTMLAVSFIIKIFITKRNKPSVTTVIGMVSTMRIGFTKVLSKASTSATINAVNTLLTCTPLSTYDTIRTASVVMSNLVKKVDMVMNYVLVFLDPA